MKGMKIQMATATALKPSAPKPAVLPRGDTAPIAAICDLAERHNA
jgi:hypothetical protein